MPTKDSENITRALHELPSYGNTVVRPDTRELFYWWATDGSRSVELIRFDITTGSKTVIPLPEDHPFDGWEPLHFLSDDVAVVSARPETKRLNLTNGTVADMLPDDEYNLVQDVSPDGARILYVSYPDPWDLRLYNRQTDSLTVIDDSPEQGGHAGFSPSGDRLAYRRNPTDTFEESQAVIVTGDGSGKRRVLNTDDLHVSLACWHPDGDCLLATDERPNLGRVGIYDLSADTTRWYGDGMAPEQATTFANGGETILGTRTHKATVRAIAYDTATGERRDIGVPAGKSHFPGLASKSTYKGGQVVVEHETALVPPRLLRYDLQSDDWTILVETQTDTLTSLDLVNASFVRVPTTDDEAVGCILYRPSGRGSYPAVVDVHGGPTTFEQPDFDPWAQFLVAHGYAVVQPNYRGSTGRGREWKRASVGDPAGSEAEDVAAVGRWVGDQAWVDEERVAVYGYSHGGWLAYCQATFFPGLWAAVVSCNGWPDLERVRTEGNPTVVRRWLGERFDDDDFLRKQNPARHVEQMSAPFLMVQSDDPELEGMHGEFLEGLRKQGWTQGEEFDVITFPNEGHVIRNTEELWPAVVTFLNKHLK